MDCDGNCGGWKQWKFERRVVVLDSWRSVMKAEGEWKAFDVDCGRVVPDM